MRDDLFQSFDLCGENLNCPSIVLDSRTNVWFNFYTPFTAPFLVLFHSLMEAGEVSANFFFFFQIFIIKSCRLVSAANIHVFQYWSFVFLR